MHSQDQDVDLAPLWTSLGAQMNILFSAKRAVHSMG